MTALLTHAQTILSKLTTLKTDLAKLQRLIDQNIRTPPATSSISQAIQLVMAESTVAPATLSRFEAAMYLLDYQYCHRALHVIVGHLLTLDDAVDAAEAEHCRLNDGGRDVDSVMRDVKELRNELWAAI